MGKSLQDVTNLKVMSFKECCDFLNWEIKEDGELVKVKCDCCDSKISYSGFIGTEVIECENCGKRIIDLFSPIRTGNSTCTILNPSDFNIERDAEGNYKHWVANEN